MNFNFKFKIPRLGLKKILGSDPRLYWSGFLWFLVFFAALVFIFDAWIFWHFSVRGNEEAPPRVELLRTRSLEKVLERIEEKEANFENYKNGVKIEDPS